MQKVKTVTAPGWDDTLSFVAGELGVSRRYLEDHVIPKWLTSPHCDDAEDLAEAVRNLASVLRIPQARLTSR